MLAAILFFVLAFMGFTGALLLVFHKNPIVASLGMAVSTVTLGVLYIFLHVPFLGFFQMIVYAGAVMVIALYVIMALGREEIGAEVGTGSGPSFLRRRAALHLLRLQAAQKIRLRRLFPGREDVREHPVLRRTSWSRTTPCPSRSRRSCCSGP